MSVELHVQFVMYALNHHKKYGVTILETEINNKGNLCFLEQDFLNASSHNITNNSSESLLKVVVTEKLSITRCSEISDD